MLGPICPHPFFSSVGAERRPQKGSLPSTIFITSTKFRPLDALLVRPTFGWLWSQNCLKEEQSYGWLCFSGVHVFQDDMSYESICLKGGHAL